MHRNRSFIRWGVVFLVLALLGTTAWLLSQETSEGLYEAALLKKEANGDLQGAIQLFQKILKQFPEKRDVAAKAQFQIGACYEKMGTAEAVKAYELVLKNYADQPELVAAARERLSAIRQGASMELSSTSLPLRDANLEAHDVSRDGTKVLGVVYDGPSDVVVYDLNAKRRQLVTHFSDGPESYSADTPVWSPDEKEIAFTQTSNDPEKTRSELRVVSLDGKSRLLWSTDDGEINPFNWLREPAAVAVLWYHKDKTYTLGLAPAEGGPISNLYTIQSPSIFPYADASPDGRYIAITEGPPNSRNIRVISTEGRGSQLVVDHPADDKDPVWSPDGKFIAFLSMRHGGFALWGVAMKEGKPDGEPFMVRDGLPRAYLLGWTDQGVVCDSYVDVNDIYVQAIDPQSMELVGRPELFSFLPSGNNASPSWSPDGESMAFAVSTKGLPAQVSVVVAPNKGGNPRVFPIPLVWWDPGWMSIAWLPDGQGLGLTASAAHAQQGESALLQLDLKTGAWKTWPLKFDYEYWVSQIDWGRDGRSVLYVKDEKFRGTAIVEKDLTTGGETPVYHAQKGQGILPRLRLSHDRRELLFVRAQGVATDADYHCTVCVLDLESRIVRELYSSRDYFMSPSWSPDDRNVLVVGGAIDPQAGIDVRIIPAQGGVPKKLRIDLESRKESEFEEIVMSADWSPDGKRIAFHVWASRTDFLLIKNVSPAHMMK